MACQGGNFDLATFLVSKGADVGATTARGMSPVHLAAEVGETDLLRVLLAVGVGRQSIVGRPLPEPNASFQEGVKRYLLLVGCASTTIFLYTMKTTCILSRYTCVKDSSA